MMIKDKDSGSPVVLKMPKKVSVLKDETMNGGTFDMAE